MRKTIAFELNTNAAGLIGWLKEKITDKDENITGQRTIGRLYTREIDNTPGKEKHLTLDSPSSWKIIGLNNDFTKLIIPVLEFTYNDYDTFPGIAGYVSSTVARTLSDDEAIVFDMTKKADYRILINLTYEECFDWNVKKYSQDSFITILVEQLEKELSFKVVKADEIDDYKTKILKEYFDQCRKTKVEFTPHAHGWFWFWFLIV
jgi:hypothetical protein